MLNSIALSTRISKDSIRWVYGPRVYQHWTKTPCRFAVKVLVEPELNLTPSEVKCKPPPQQNDDESAGSQLLIDWFDRKDARKVTDTSLSPLSESLCIQRGSNLSPFLAQKVKK